jgi:hypothetical protein
MRRSGGRGPLGIGLFAIDAFAAVSAVGGGIALMAGLESARFPCDWLRGTPFSSYVIPGLILAVAVGGSATVAAAATLRSPRAGTMASLLAGVVMMGWIVGEFLILNQPSRPTWTEVVYFSVGVTMALLGLLGLEVWRIDRKQTNSTSERVHAR